MKLRLIIAEGLEEKILFIAKKYFPTIPPEQASQIVLSLAKSDPTPQKKYLEWIARLLSIENIRMPEDGPKILETLTKFAKSSGINKDINSYKTFGDLAKALESTLGASNRELKSKGRAGEFALPKGAVIIIEEGPLKVVKIVDPNASSILASGTKWCVANRETAQDYLKEGPLYLVYVNEQRDTLIHYPSGQFMDVHDDNIPTQKAEIYVSLLSDFENIEDHEESMWILRLAPPEKRTGPIESPEYVPYLAKHPRLAVKYSNVILRRPWRDTKWPEIEKTIARSESSIAYMNHVKFGLDGRWPEAENWILANSPQMAVEYACKVLYRRWPEAEKLILTDPDATAEYACSIRNRVNGIHHIKRWREAEPIILKADPKLLAQYAVIVIQDRWRRAEPKILTNPWAAVKYMPVFLGQRWPEAEPIILSNMRTAIIYAKDIKQRIPEIEPTLLNGKNLDNAIRYGATFFARTAWPELESILLNRLAASQPRTHKFDMTIIDLFEYNATVRLRRWIKLEGILEKLDLEADSKDIENLKDNISSYCEAFDLTIEGGYFERKPEEHDDFDPGERMNMLRQRYRDG